MKRRKPRTITVPPLFRQTLNAHPIAAELFESFPTATRRSSLTGFASAKKEETRRRRLEKMITMLLAKKPGRGE